MASIKDDRGYNQGFKPSLALKIRTERRCEYIISKMNLEKDTRILEIGCGTGELSYLLAKKTGVYVLGTDLCRPFIKEAKKNYSLSNLNYEVLDFNDEKNVSRLARGKFDYVVGNGILHHLYFHIDEALKNIRKLLKDNGKIIFLEPNIFNPYCFLIFNFPVFRKMANLEPEEMAFGRGFISKRLAEAGYHNMEVEYRDFLLPSTPSYLIEPSIAIGAVAEKIPVLNRLAQSVFISATKSK